MNLVRHCRKCDTTTPWGDLRFIGMQEIPGEPSTELRNCHCGATFGESARLAEAETFARVHCQLGIVGACEVVAWLSHGVQMGSAGRAWLVEQMAGDGRNAELAEVLYDRLVGEL